MRKSIVDIWLITPLQKFINNSTTSGIILFVSALIALIAANSPWAEEYHHIWEHKFSIGYDDFVISKDLHHWINDGLMAIFFFVIGLELKREIIAGELSSPKDAVLPLAAGLGGMVVPALIYLAFNASGQSSNGWGIPMATDIAFALGILYLLGNRVPLSLKIFLTALAIADDLGAVLVIAFFYTSNIDFISLAVGGAFMAVLIIANLIGVRNTTFYGVVGIAGLWLAFLMSGVHATIAAVLAALTIPAYVKFDEDSFSKSARTLMSEFDKAERTDDKLVSKEQLYVLEKFKYLSKEAMTPLQRLEHALHPFVAFVVMPIFALANAGVTFSGNFSDNVFSPVALGIIFGLIIGKTVGIIGMSKLMVWLKLAKLPDGVRWPHIYGASLLAAVGFTMSLFITELAFTDANYILQAKIGILVASFIAGLAGYVLLRKTTSNSRE
ncbi:MAG TPA: Na+/H+ antiporter NhaA [Cyclobacteriaceae bacterium]|nr:Na+/H+ antiporter NhaA [Cyclobacteriaceae bacterium]